MTLDEKLTELESRHTVATLSPAVGVYSVPVKRLITRLIGEMRPGQSGTIFLCDQYGKRGALFLAMGDNDLITWRCTGPIEDALNALH